MDTQSTINEEHNKTTITPNTANTKTNLPRGLSLKKTVLNYTDKLENLFALRLYKIINKHCKINVDFKDDQFCCVDYRIQSRATGNVMYLELKSRDKKYANVPTFFMGHRKMINIRNNNYNKCLLVWNFDTQLFYRVYDVKLIKYKQKIIQNSPVIEVNKDECSSGIENLVKEIYKILNIDIIDE